MFQIQRSNGGNDIIQYATACADNIPELQVFKSNCKPLFLLMAGGVLVGFVHGADGGKMREVMQEQGDKELQIMKGDGTRQPISMHDAIPASEDIDEDEDEENRKKNMKSLKGAIISKKVVATF
jgi:hypothetical protein